MASFDAQAQYLRAWTPNGPVFATEKANGPCFCHRKANGPVFATEKGKGLVFPTEQAKGLVFPGEKAKGLVFPAEKLKDLAGLGLGLEPGLEAEDLAVRVPDRWAIGARSGLLLTSQPTNAGFRRYLGGLGPYPQNGFRA